VDMGYIRFIHVILGAARIDQAAMVSEMTMSYISYH
jgi:hypothetical protein